VKARFGFAFWAKAFATGIILCLVLRRVEFPPIRETLAHAKFRFLLLAMSIALPLGITAVQRWRSVMAAFGEKLSFSRALRYSWIGQFVNLGVPTVVGLDAVRTWKLHEQGTSIGLAARIVVVDRLCSLASLLLLIGIAIPHLLTLSGSDVFKSASLVAFTIGCVGLGLLAMLHLLGGGLRKTSRLRHLYQLSFDFDRTLFGNKILAGKILLWSICNHLCRVVIVICLAFGLSIRLAPFDAFTLVPSALLLAMVPISLAGWGVREVVFIQALSLAGIAAANAVALSLLYGLIGLVMGIVGGGIWLAERKKPAIRSSSSERQVGIID
jgi:uncharacterized membrane protein YbhN (UPF0104 family)